MKDKPQKRRRIDAEQGRIYTKYCCWSSAGLSIIVEGMVHEKHEKHETREKNVEWHVS